MQLGNFEAIPSPYGGWEVREVNEDGVLHHFKRRNDAYKYLEKLSGEELPPEAIVIDMDDGSVDVIPRPDQEKPDQEKQEEAD